MNFLVVGPGAMGCLFAARLKLADHTVTLLDYRRERADHINAHGIRVEGITGNYEAKIPVVTQRPPEEQDVILICVKANKTREVAGRLKDWIEGETRVLTLQNGLGNVESLGEVLGEERVLGGVTAEGATLLGPGHIRHAGQGETVVGPGSTSSGPVGRVVSAFNDAGFRTRAAESVKDLIWGKLVINVGINALTAITRLKNGLLPQIQGTRWVMERAVQEAITLAHAKGIRLPYSDPLERVIGVCQATSENIASMLQDVLNQRITEVEFINGAIATEGQSSGIPTPVNHVLTCLVQATQETYRQRIKTE
jgi:2-dehydropantoate 2-reductase